MRIRNRLNLDLDGVVLQDCRQVVQEGEEIIGELPEELRPLWSYLYQTSSELSSLKSSLEEKYRSEDSRSNMDPADIHGYRELEGLFRFLGNQFWVETRKRFAEIEKELGVRQGWQVVAYSPDRYRIAGYLVDADNMDLLVLRVREEVAGRA